MGEQYEELPRWEFTIVEASLGLYTVRAVGDGGLQAESKATADPEAALKDLRSWAQNVEDDLARKQSGGGLSN